MNIHKISLRFPPSFLVLTSSVPKSQTHWLKHISDMVLYILENSLNWSTCWVFTSLIDWNKTGEIFNSTWTFVYLLGFFLNLKYKVITFSTIWQHTFISTEESCFDITQLPKYLQTLKFWSTAIDRYRTSFPHVQWDCQSTSSLWTLVSELVTAACTSTSLQSAQLGNFLSTHIRSS